MTYEEAKTILRMQDRRIRKIDGTRLFVGDFEYRISYYGGFASYVAIDRRQIGKRNFKYFSGVGAYNCWTVGEVLDLINEEIMKKQ